MRLGLWDKPDWRCKVCGKGNDGYATQGSRLPFVHRHLKVRLSGRQLANWEKHGFKTVPMPGGLYGLWVRFFGSRPFGGGPVARFSGWRARRRMGIA